MPDSAMVFYHMIAFSKLHMIKFSYVSESTEQLHAAGMASLVGQNAFHLHRKEVK